MIKNYFIYIVWVYGRWTEKLNFGDLMTELFMILYIIDQQYIHTYITEKRTKEWLIFCRPSPTKPWGYRKLSILYDFWFRFFLMLHWNRTFCIPKNIITNEDQILRTPLNLFIGTETYKLCYLTEEWSAYATK